MRRKFLLIPHIKIHNSNAMSSPYTIGFPAMTAWLGAVHALQRRVRSSCDKFENIDFLSVAVSCHAFNLQTYQGPGDFVSSIIGTANPLDKNGDRPAFVEEARCHLEVSLLVEYNGIDADENEWLKKIIFCQVQCMKFASGDVISVNDVSLITVNEDEDNSVREICRKLMLGYVLIERRDLMIKTMQEEGKDALDALLDYLKVMHRSTQGDEGKVLWASTRKEAGWLVPIAVGFQGISGLGVASNQRDVETPHRFAESVVTLGEFVMPYRIRDLDEILWQYQIDIEKNLYLCQTKINSLT